MKRIIYKIFIAFSTLLPSLAFAQSLSNSTFKDVILSIVSVFAILNPILFAVAFVVFFWGLTRFILHSGSQPDIERGKNYMFWGVIALFLLVAFRAIVLLVIPDLGLGTSVFPVLPTSP